MNAKTKKIAAILVLVIAVGIAAQAGVLVVNQLTVNTSHVMNPVQFGPGSNVGGTTGLEGTAIAVDLVNNNSVATVTFKIPPGESLIIDALRVANVGVNGTDYYFTFKTVSSSLTGIITAEIIVWNPNNGSKVAVYDVASGTFQNNGGGTYALIPSGATYYLIFKFVTDNTWAPGSTASYTVQLLYATDPAEFAYSSLT